MEIIMKITFLTLVLPAIGTCFIYVARLVISNLIRNLYCYSLFSV
jgi:hypothetical protein